MKSEDYKKNNNKEKNDLYTNYFLIKICRKNELKSMKNLTK